MPHKLNLGASVESLPRINPGASDLKILLGDEKLLKAFESLAASGLKRHLYAVIFNTTS